MQHVSLVSIPWTPTEIDKNIYTVLCVLINSETIELDTDKSFKKFLENSSLDFDKFIKQLLETKLVYVDEGKMRLLVDELHTVFSPEGKIYAGENGSGEMTNYFLKK